MTKDDMKNGLASVQAELVKIEEAARKLKNQNYADIVASAHRRITQMLEHHDLDAVHAEMEGSDKPEELPFDPKAGLSNEAPKANDTYRPGDQRFDQPNKDFRQPNDVTLNADGTLRTAPNALGQQDVRKE